MLTETQTFSDYITKNMLKVTFEKYVYNKTDILTEEHLIKVPEGLDGVKVDHFQKTLNHQVDSIYKRLKKGSL